MKKLVLRLVVLFAISSPVVADRSDDLLAINEQMIDAFEWGRDNLSQTEVVSTWDVSKMETTTQYPIWYQFKLPHYIDWSGQISSWYQIPKSIIIHHSATPASNDYDKALTAINRSHAKRVHWLQPSNQLQDKYPDISYHYVIFPDGHIEQTRREIRVGWATRENNDWVIHILLIGDFSKEKPTNEQYKALNDKISDIQTRYSIWSITWHGQEDWEHTTCPWPLFDYLRVDQVKKRTEAAQPTDPNYLGTFHVTKYYSCDPAQTKRLSREKNTGQDNYEACNKRQFNGDIDNTQPKRWARFTNADAWLSVACPPGIKGWTKLRIEWYDPIVTCRDVWSAIKNKRLDLYVGIGDRAIENYTKFPAGSRRVWIEN